MIKGAAKSRVVTLIRWNRIAEFKSWLIRYVLVKSAAKAMDRPKSSNRKGGMRIQAIGTQTAITRNKPSVNHASSAGTL